MTEFAWHGYTVEVDEPATRAWYAQAEEWSCTCGHCRNFLALAKERQLPEELLNILDGLGIPPEKATYVCELYHDESWQEKGLLYQLCWRVAGKITGRPAGADDGPTWGPRVEFPWGGLELGRETFPVEPDFPEPNFDLNVSLYLPWVLDEHVDGPGKRKDEP